MERRPAGKTILFSNEESNFLLQKHHQYSKQLANKKNYKFKNKKDVWDQISLDIQMKFNKQFSSKQCATRLDTIQKKARRKRSKMALHAKRNSHLQGHFMDQYDMEIENSKQSFNDDESNCAASNSPDYLNKSERQAHQPTGAELISAPDGFFTINYPQPAVRIPAESVNPLSIISSVGLSRRPNILTPPVSTASSSSNNEITSTTIASAALNTDRGEVPFLKKSLEKERELVRTLQLQISHYEGYIEILLQRIKDLDNVSSSQDTTDIMNANTTNMNDTNVSTNEGTGDVKQEPT